RIAEDDLKPRESITAGIASTLTNLRAIPYEARPMERILLSTMRAVSLLGQGEIDRARPELIAASFRQQDAADRQRKAIESTTDSRSISRANTTRATDEARVELTAGLEQFQPYGDFVNPFTEWLQAVYFYGVAQDGEDLSRSRTAWRRLAGMVPGNEFVIRDLAMIDGLASARARPAMTFVVFATGFGPRLEEQRLDLPLFLVNDTVDYFGVAIPVPAFNSRFERSLDVFAADAAVRTQMLADMDRIFVEQYNAELPAIIAKTLLAASAKAATAFGLSAATEDDETLNAIVRIVASLYQASVNQADLRSWAGLPKQWAYASVRTPDDGIVVIESAGERASVEVVPGSVNLIYVRSLGPSDRLRIFSVDLGAAGVPASSKEGAG
ncbi:MAG: hypothetical protein AAF747_07190, partial [Planctomycetota bacterium]